MKNKLSLGISGTKKNLKRTGVSSILAVTIIGHFSGIFCIHSSSISAYSWRLKDNTLFSESISDVKSLSIIIVPAQERAECITENEKDQVDIVM